MQELFRGELDVNGDLKQEYINQAISNIQTKKAIMEKIDKYYRGENSGIDTYLSKYTALDRETYIPIKNNLTQIPIRTMAGYMYKNNYITTPYDMPVVKEEYQDNEAELQKAEDNAKITKKQVDDIINQIYWENNEDITTSQVGIDAMKYGVSYKLLYTVGKNIEDIYITELYAGEVELVYNKELKPTKIAGVRYYYDDIAKTDYLEIYYKDRVVYYYKKVDDKEYTRNQVIEHYFGDIPIVEYKNNADNISDVTPIISLNDQYDIAITELNHLDQTIPLSHVEVQKLYGAEMNKVELIELVNDIKARAFSITAQNADGDSKQNVYYHNRVIDTEYLKFTFSNIKEAMEYSSGIPNIFQLIDIYRNQKSVESILYILEIKASEKEAYFKDGEYYKLKLLSNILNFMKIKGLPEIDYNNFNVRMERNKPETKGEKIDDALKLLDVLTEEDVIKMLAPLINMDADELIKNIEMKRQLRMKEYNLGVNNGMQDKEEEAKAEEVNKEALNGL